MIAVNLSRSELAKMLIFLRSLEQYSPKLLKYTNHGSVSYLGAECTKLSASMSENNGVMPSTWFWWS